MARDPGGSRRPVVVAASAAVVTLLLAGTTSMAGAAPRKGTTLAKAAQLAQSGHAAFWECPAKTTEMLVAVNTLNLHSGSTLHISFTVRNDGTVSCNYTAPYARRGPRPHVHGVDGGPVRLGELPSRRQPPPQRLARDPGRQLSGPRLR